MGPSLAFSLLLLSFFLYNATAIRLEQGFMQVGHQRIQDEKGALIKQSNGGLGEVSPCKGGHCKGLNRKLTTVNSSTSTISTTSSKNEENGGNKFKPSGEHEKFAINSSQHEEMPDHDHDEYVDIMDYSPAKRKPPIHN